MSVPSDKTLYSETKKLIYKKYPKHSAYRSGLLVKAYKKAFIRDHGLLKQPYKGKKPVNEGLDRWFKEDWKSDTGKVGYSSKSSVYRPTKRITKDTPKTFSELTTKEIQKAKREKFRTGRVGNF